jgi:hypothetical protein
MKWDLVGADATCDVDRLKDLRLRTPQSVQQAQENVRINPMREDTTKKASKSLLKVAN